MEQCGVQPARAGRLMVRKRASAAGDQQAWFFTNPTDAEAIESIDVSGWAKVEDLMSGRVRRNAGRVELTVKGLDVRVLVVSR